MQDRFFGYVKQAWRYDYEPMLRTMIYGEQISFDEMMRWLTELQEVMLKRL